LYDTRLNHEDILLLTVLCQYTDRDGHCFPSFETVSKTFSPLVGRGEPYSKAAISARMARLEAAGYVRDGGHRKNAIGGYGTKNWYVLHDGQLPAEFDRSAQTPAAPANTSVQNLRRFLNTSVKKSPTISERNDPRLTINNNNNSAPAAPNVALLPATNPAPQIETVTPHLAWFQELERVVMVFDGQSMSDLADAWAKFPDARRHTEAMRQLQNARMRTARVYLKAFLNFNPDWKPPTNDKASADRSKKPIPRGNNGNAAPAMARAQNAPPPTNAERLAQWKAARVAAGMDTRGIT